MTSSHPGIAGMTEIEISVPTAVGDLAGIISSPAGSDGRAPGLVLVDGSGDGDRLHWGEFPGWLVECGAVVLRHDKPGCGGSPGEWRDQSIEDRARETLAAAHVLRAAAGTIGRPVGLYGISQGGWVALLAAALEPDAVDFVVCDSGPGTTPAEQERERLEGILRSAGYDERTIAQGLAWVDERFARIRRGDSPQSVLAEQTRHAGEPWYDAVLSPYDTAENLRFVGRIMDFDPTEVMPRIGCPVLALFGAADSTIPVQASVEAFARHLPPNTQHGLAVFPDADHGLFVMPPEPGVARRDQLAPAYLPTVAAFLARMIRAR